MSCRARFTSLVLAATLSCIPLYAQFSRDKSHLAGPGETTTVTIIVRTGDNLPVHDARVEVRDGNGVVIASGYTGQGGTLDLAGRFVGTYEIVATHGLNEAREQLQGRNGDSSITLRLSAKDTDEVDGNGATVSVAQYRVPSKARKEYRKAEDAVNKSKLDEASAHIAKALELYPNYAQALCLRAVLSMDTNQRESAAADLEHAIQLDPSYPTAYFALGAVYNLMSRFDDALLTLDHGITISPASWQGYFEMAKAQIGKANYPLALHSLEKSQSLAKENYPLIYLVKAHTLLSLKQYPEAMVALEAFLQRAPQDPHSDTARKMLAQAKAFAGEQ